MPRILVLIALLTTAAAAPSRTAAAAAAPDAEEPARAVIDPPARPSQDAQRPGPEILLGSLQLVLGYAAEIGALAAMAGTGLTPKDVGIHSEFGGLLFFTSLIPAAAGGAVCGAGYLSSSYRGRCWTTFLGAYSGAALGIVLGVLLAPPPGPDDTDAFMKSMAALAGMFLLTPVGAVIGYHVGKREIPRERATAATAEATADVGRLFATPVAEPRRGTLAVSQPRLMLPLVSVSW